MIIMPSTLVNLVLLGTAWSPVILIIGVHEALCRACWTIFFVSAGVALALLFICMGIFRFAKRRPGQPIEIKEIERNDQEVLTFILVTMLPIMRASGETVVGQPIVVTLIVLLVTVTLLQARAYHFNPVIRLFLRYRCYSIKTIYGTPILLISRADLRLPCELPEIVKLTNFVWLQK